MKKLLLATLFCIGTLSYAQAQQALTASNSASDYEKFISNYAEVEFRNYAIEQLNLTEEEIIAFDPIYREYMEDKNDLAEKKFEMLQEFREDWIEEDGMEEKTDEKGEFMEDYWQVEIDLAQVRKNYFDKLEDAISPAKAFGFFVLEDMLESDIQKVYVEKRYVPVFIKTGKMKMKNKKWKSGKKGMKASHSSNYSKEVESYVSWANQDRGKVTLDHDYTHNGLTSLANALNSMAVEAGIADSDFQNQKKEVMQLADELRKNWKSTDHADKTRKAFTTVATMMEYVKQAGNISQCDHAVSKVQKAATKINPNELMTNQAAHIYNFFDTAKHAITMMSSQISWASN